ncbi:MULTISPECIES: YfhD family protein [Alteribacter]|uniref:YfhD family protein n=1 Tax=Alteribacter keqinensis TaxID=2483800 RepID=A0A3M7TUW9_9BACI|nr:MULTISPECIES: YfhD family protein [Alteribacter]MBM7094418.1 YfhD family protein [Alteribacter salitolerans]RNA69357.1 YfhD family protein [Alteribacter keqinensis]
MGRARKQKARDKNKQTLPQTPKKDIKQPESDQQ